MDTDKDSFRSHVFFSSSDFTEMKTENSDICSSWDKDLALFFHMVQTV